jgi:molybdopterin/thiamine biosynthesis adenylyltransferase
MSGQHRISRSRHVLEVFRMDDDIYERQRRVWDQEKVSKISALVGGAGALGNEVVKNLVQIGVQRVYVVDFDRVVPSNLNRCIFFRRSDAARRARKVDVLSKRAMQLNPDAEVIPIYGDVKDLSSKVLSNVDVAFSTFDNIYARLVLNQQTYGRGIPLIDGGIEGMLGNVTVVVPPETPCIECGITDMDLEHLWDKISCGGEATNIDEPKIPYVPMSAAVVAGIQVAEAIKIVLGREGFKRDGRWPHGLGEPMMGKTLFIDLTNNTFFIYGLQRKTDCNICS